MPYTPSPFQPGDLVETTEAYRTWAQKYYVSFGRRTSTYSKGLIKSVHVLHHKDTGLPIMDYIILDNGVAGKVEHFKKVSFKCPDCKEETEKITVEGNVFFSCNNIFCGNIKLYDVFTLQARSPIIQKVE
jgi:hypothetical protein